MSCPIARALRSAQGRRTACSTARIRRSCAASLRKGQDASGDGAREPDERHGVENGARETEEPGEARRPPRPQPVRSGATTQRAATKKPKSSGAARFSDATRSVMRIGRGRNETSAAVHSPAASPHRRRASAAAASAAPTKSATFTAFAAASSRSGAARKASDRSAGYAGERPLSARPGFASYRPARREVLRDPEEAVEVRDGLRRDPQDHGDARESAGGDDRGEGRGVAARRHISVH